MMNCTRFVLMAAFLLLAIASALQAQTATVVLTWEDARNPAGTAYNVYRADGLCFGAPVFSRIAQGVTEKAYSDPRPPGDYCYVVTATANAKESVASNTAHAMISASVPLNVKASVVE